MDQQQHPQQYPFEQAQPPQHQSQPQSQAQPGPPPSPVVLQTHPGSFYLKGGMTDDEEDNENNSEYHASRQQQQAQAKEKQEREEIAKRETTAVFWLRLSVLLVLLVSAVTVSVLVYLYTTHQERQAWEQKFHNDASKVLEAVGKSLAQTLAATDGFIMQMIAYARYSSNSTNGAWPFVTMPAFAIHATKLLKVTKAFYFSIYPVVRPNQRTAWEAYANASKGWIDESLEIQANDQDWKGPVETNYNFSYRIFANDRNHTEPFPHKNTYLPSWQVHPMVVRIFFFFLVQS
jgi:cell division protein FtsL